MGLIGKLKAKFCDDYCSKCQHKMDVAAVSLYALPDMMVGHYVIHKDPGYYKKHLVPIRQKSQVPAGMYACSIQVYQCPQCGHRPVKMRVFLPVREEEKTEQMFYFENGEMNDFIFGAQR